jgi:hypothetical protein
VATSGPPQGWGPQIYGTPPPARPKRNVGRIIAIVAGSLLAIIGVCAVLGGATLLWLNGKKHDGFFTTSAEQFTTPLNAISSSNLEISESGDASVLNAMFGKLRFNVRAADDQPMFIGIGRTADVNAYLAGVGHEQLQDIQVDPFSATYTTSEGDVTPEKPGAQDFWTVSTEGPGQRTLTWKVEEGNWSIVVMNADGSRPVEANVSVGASLPLIGTLAWISLLVGSLFMLAGVLLILGAIMWRRRATTTP